jgi:hypothetical protein
MFGIGFSQVTAVGVWVAVMTLIGIFVKQIVPFKKIESDTQAAFRADLMQYVLKLEQKMTQLQIRHEAERRVDRHKLRNITQCFDAIMLLLKTVPPEALPRVIKEVEEMRARQITGETEESAQVDKVMLEMLNVPVPLREV